MQKQYLRDNLLEVLAEFDIYAPMSGMIIYSKGWRGKIKTGSTISPWNPVVAELPDLSSMISKTYINEIDIRKVILGNKVNQLLFLILLLFTPINGFNNIWLQKYYIDTRHLNQIMATISVTFTSGAEFLGLILGGVIVDKISYKQPHKRFLIGFISALLAVPCFYFPFVIFWRILVEPTENMNFIEICWYMFDSAISDWRIFISYTLLFFGFFFLTFIGLTILPSISEYNRKEHKTIVTDLFLTIYYISWIISPVMGGVIGDIFNLQITFLFEPFFYMIVAILFFIVYIFVR